MPSRNVFTIEDAPDQGFEIQRDLLLGKLQADHGAHRSPLLAVTTRAEKISGCECGLDSTLWRGAPSPPISSTNTSISGSTASCAGCPDPGRNFLAGIALLGLRARCDRHHFDRPAATPPPATSSRAINRTSDRRSGPEAGNTHFEGGNHEQIRDELRRACLTPLGERNDVVQFFPVRFQGTAGCCAPPGECVVRSTARCERSLRATLAKAGARRNHLGVLGPAAWQIRRCPFPETVPGLATRRTSTQSGAAPASRRGKSFRSAASGGAIDVAHFLDAFVRAIERGCRCQPAPASMRHNRDTTLRG